MARLFPSGQVCARQVLDTVERMGDADEAAEDADAAGDDDGQTRTFLAAGSRPGPSRRADDASEVLVVEDDAPDAEPAREPRSTPALAWKTWWLAALGAGILATAALTYALTRAASTPTAARPQQAPAAAAPAAAPGNRVELEPVRLPSGELVYRLGAQAAEPGAAVCPPP
jgi:hypothetical protein